MTPTIAILTDFGTLDAYVGAMKGVIKSICPQATLVDLSHDIPRGDIHRGAFELWRVKDYFPERTIFLSVVDPGVGTQRRGIALASDDHLFVGPDNGIFTYCIIQAEAISAFELTNRRYQAPSLSMTFHGRDLFAPAAAHLALDTPIEEFGSAVTDLQGLDTPTLDIAEETLIKGEVLHADQFGNIITSIGVLEANKDSISLKSWLAQLPKRTLPKQKIQVTLPDSSKLPLKTTFAEVSQGEPVAYIGSSGLLEIGVNLGRADDTLGLEPGQNIYLST